MPDPPTVSVVTSTYNRSNVLRVAIESVLGQTFGDWEHWIVGDACTDDTAEAVSAFGDPRIRFHNLERNVGEQSGPNNVGVGLARGRYVAFLNHDDLWLSDHLEIAVEQLERTGADMVYGLTDHVRPDGPDALLGASASGHYEPGVTAPMSCWVLRPEAFERVGPLRSYREIYDVPSHDWLFRAWRAGLRMLMLPVVTVVVFPSGSRPGVYVDDPSEEQRHYLRRMREEADFRERELTALAVAHAVGQTRPRPIRHWAGRAVFDLLRRTLPRLGVNPIAGYRFLTRRSRGRVIDDLRRKRGLPPLKRSDL